MGLARVSLSSMPTGYPVKAVFGHFQLHAISVQAGHAHGSCHAARESHDPEVGMRSALHTFDDLIRALMGRQSSMDGRCQMATQTPRETIAFGLIALVVSTPSTLHRHAEIIK